jgi:predicted SAM-dependent methyltransferase
MKLHIGARVRIEGWKTLDIAPGPDVDFVGDCKNLAQFADASVEAIYASHVLEHVPYRLAEATLKEWHRVLAPGGTIMISVPDLETLANLYVNARTNAQARRFVMQMMFGGQADDHDFHYAGYDAALLAHLMKQAGFVEIARVSEFGVADDTSRMRFFGVPISLNLSARKPAV